LAKIKARQREPAGSDLRQGTGRERPAVDRALGGGPSEVDGAELADQAAPQTNDPNSARGISFLTSLRYVEPEPEGHEPVRIVEAILFLTENDQSSLRSPTSKVRSATSLSLPLRQFHRHVERGADHPRAAIGVDEGLLGLDEGFEIKKKFFGKHGKNSS
jgi:hypothetical protein